MGADAGGLARPSRRDVKEPECVLLEWRVHLFRRDPRRALAIPAAAALAAFLGYGITGSWALSLLGVLLIAGAASEYLFPISYRLTTEGAYAAYGLTRLQMEWRRVRRVLDAEGRMKLSPFHHATPLENVRGIVLWCAPEGSPGCHSQVRAIVLEQVEAAKNAHA
ncbi:MAG: hypothetical protein ACP5VE_01855 [Chthonomonadales bacterium]